MPRVDRRRLPTLGGRSRPSPPRAAVKDLDETKAPLFDHLVELRKRLLICLAVLVAAFFAFTVTLGWSFMYSA